jgi:hypothetical protein
MDGKVGASEAEESAEVTRAVDYLGDLLGAGGESERRVGGLGGLGLEGLSLLGMTDGRQRGIVALVVVGCRVVEWWRSGSSGRIVVESLVVNLGIWW